MDKITRESRGTDALIRDDFELRTASVLLQEVIHEIDKKRLSLTKAAPVVVKIAEKIAKIKEIHHERRHGRRVSINIETVAMVFNKFETLIKVVCSDDISKLEKFAEGLKGIGDDFLREREKKLPR